MKKYALASQSLPHPCVYSLLSLGFEVILLPPYENLSAPVASHPDMLMFPFGKEFLIAGDYYRANKALFEPLERLGYRALVTDISPRSPYPGDIPFNCLALGRNIFGLYNSISPEILAFAQRNGMNITGVKQGYAKCSVCAISDNAAITSDPSMYSALRAAGVDVLRIREGHIRLDGFEYGFIGGATGVCGDTVYFCGNLNAHPDGKQIADFCALYEKNCVSLSDDILFEAGTLFFF